MVRTTKSLNSVCVLGGGKGGWGLVGDLELFVFYEGSLTQFALMITLQLPYLAQIITYLRDLLQFLIFISNF